MIRIRLFLVVLFLATVVSTLYLDRPIAWYFHEHPLDFFKAVTTLGYAGPWLILFFVLMLWYRRRASLLYKKTLFLFASVAVSGILVDLIKPILGKARPKLLFEEGFYGLEPWSFKASFWSMPSGHSATAFALGVALALLYPGYRGLFLLLAGLVAASRVILTRHYLSDVLVGSAIGALTALWLYQRIFCEER